MEMKGGAPNERGAHPGSRSSKYLPQHLNRFGSAGDTPYDRASALK